MHCSSSYLINHEPVLEHGLIFLPVSSEELPEARTSDKNARAGIWEIYANEAKQYDEGLVKSWKEDMDALLVFSGLYSAVLTAFVIQSYQSLVENPGDKTVALLSRISDQLDSSATNSKTSTLSGTSDPFVPFVSDVVCNILWFLSLSFALLCAFLATFVQQWCRQFLHRLSITRSPTSRARFIHFLYSGMKDFQMHMIVDLIPFLLHLSLLLFFCGLVSFLYEVNKIVMWIIVGILVHAVALYIFLTVLPLIRLNSPYQTPLSPLIWRLWAWFGSTIRFGMQPESPRTIWAKTSRIRTRPAFKPAFEAQPGGSNNNMLANDLLQARVIASNTISHAVESKLILWTVKSLDNDLEFYAFVEALSDALDGPESDPGTIFWHNPQAWRSGNAYLVFATLDADQSHSSILFRLLSLLEKAEYAWADEMQRHHCVNTCLKVVCAVFHIQLERLEETSTGQFLRHLPMVCKILHFLHRVIMERQVIAPPDYCSTALVLGALLVWRNCEEAMESNPIPLEAIFAIDQVFDHFYFPHIGYGWHGPNEWHLKQQPEYCRLAVTEFKENAIKVYLFAALKCIPYRFGYVIALLGLDRMVSNGFIGSDAFRRALAYLFPDMDLMETSWFNDPDRQRPSPPSAADLPLVGSLLDCGLQINLQTSRGLAGSCIAEFLANYVKRHGWGSTLTIWDQSACRGGQFGRFHRHAALPNSILFEENLPQWTIAYQEFFSCLAFRGSELGADDAYFISTLISNLRATPHSAERQTLLFLTQIAAVILIDRSAWKSKDGPWDVDLSTQILRGISNTIQNSNQLSQFVSSGEFLRLDVELERSETAKLGVLLLLQILCSKLAATDLTFLIRIYYSNMLSYNFTMAMASSTDCLNMLATRTVELGHSILQSQDTSRDLLTLNRFVWNLWSKIKVHAPVFPSFGMDIANIEKLWDVATRLASLDLDTLTQTSHFDNLHDTPSFSLQDFCLVDRVDLLETVRNCNYWLNTAREQV